MTATHTCCGLWSQAVAIDSAPVSHTSMRDSVFDAEVPTAESVAGAARHCLGAVAVEAGQAGFAICVAVTVAHAHVASASATPIPTDCRELWQHAVVRVDGTVAGAARDRREAVALEAGQARFAICVAVTVALAHVASASATPTPTDFRELWQHAVVHVDGTVAGAARDRREAVALEAGQAGFAICVAVTVALAHVAFASATPTTTDCRELWQHAVVRVDGT
eukprot:scaffold77877_cov58-Phaeocystis_antarctica.AAC.3